MADGGVIIRTPPSGEWHWEQDLPSGAGIGTGGGGSSNIWCKWGTTNWKYSLSPYKWKQSCIGLVIEILRHTGGPEPDARLGDWLEKHPSKKRKLIELLCRIDGKTYTEKKYVNDNAKITVKDVKNLARVVLGEKIFKVDGEVITGKKKDISVTVQFD